MAQAVAGRAARREPGAAIAQAPRDPFPLLWLLPVLFLVVLFTAYPVAHALYTSLHRVMVLLPGEPFVGLANYRAVLGSDYFWTATRNSLWFTLISAPLTVLLGLAVAHLLLAEFRGRIVVRSVVILPWALPGAITAVIWLWIFHPSWGLLNLGLYELGLISEYIPWLRDRALVRLSVIVAHVWSHFPFSAVLLMAALTAIPTELYEQAKIDGASTWQRFRYIAFPQIKAFVVILLIYESLLALTSYDIVYAMTGGGPGTATTLLAFQIWRESFSQLNFGQGAAVAFLMVLLSIAFIVGILKTLPSDIFGEE
jgi:multiple sugar transport system permease protein